MRCTKNRVFQFSWYITGPALLLILIMCRLSYWQWTRHLEKVELIKEMDQRLLVPPGSINDTLAAPGSDWNQSMVHRRLTIEGSYDFEHEMILRNRRHLNQPGVMILTPLKIKDTNYWILVNRGYIPLKYATRETRAQFQKPPSVKFVGLIKETNPKRFLAPSDPPAGGENPWVDEWLRVDLANIGKQLPYQILPIYTEVMPSADLEKVRNDILSAESSKSEILSLVARSATTSRDSDIHQIDLDLLPIPLNDLIIPPGRHLGYVFEWIILAILTAFLAVIIQLRSR
jgi:cytochrome oxidase assembly protein ShyY1